MSRSRSFRDGRPFALFATAVVLTVAAITGFLLLRGTHEPTSVLPALVAWGVLLACVDLLPVPVWRGIQMLMDFPLLIAMAILYAPAVAATVVFIGSFDPRELRAEVGLVRALFNRAQLALSALVAGLVFRAVGTAGWGFRTVVAAGGAITLAYLVNVGLVGLGAIFLHRQRASVVFRELRIGRPLDFVVNYVSLGLVGVAFAALYRTAGFWAVIGLLIPLVFARQAFMRSLAMEGLRGELEEAYRDQGERLEALQRLERERSELSRVLTHDFLNAITALRVSALATTRRWDYLGDEERLDSAQWMERETARIREMTEQIVTIMSLDSDVAVVEARNVPAIELVRQAADAVQELGGRLKVRVEPDAEHSVVLADPPRALQVLRNLLTNAEKYSEPDTLVELRLEASGDDVVFVVTDTGEGIGIGDVDLLFQRFSRLPSAITSGVPGSGLGLYISRRIAEAHGGRLWLESEPGRGSSFFFTLPAPLRPA